MSLKCIVFLYVIKYIIVNDCFVICVGSSLLSKTVDVTVPCIPAEAARIARLRASRIVSCPSNDSSTSAEEAQHSDTQSTNPPTGTDPRLGDDSEDRARGQTDPEDAAEQNQWWHPRNWEAIIEEAEGLAYDDPRSDTPRREAPCMSGSPMDHMLLLEAAVAGGDAIEVHVDKAELDKL